jgi:maltoporin
MLKRLILPQKNLAWGLIPSAIWLLTGATGFAQSTSQSEMDALKAHINQLENAQKQYQDRISNMESQIKSLESQAHSGTILNTKVLTDENGTAVEPTGPALDQSFLKSITRNFSFSAYIRSGVQFNGNGGGGNFNFEPPDTTGGRSRLGNENDVYMELTWAQAHLLGDGPDVVDASMYFTPAIRYVQSRNTFTVANSGGNDFNFVMRQAYVEMKNVFKGAPEVTFWAGQRFYDRWNIDPNDYFYLDTSGYGAGVENIDVGIGKLWLAYLGGLNDTFVSPNEGTFYKHTFDLRVKDINVGIGKLMLVLIGNYEKGTTFTNFGFVGNSNDGQPLPNPLKTDDAWGIGGGFIYQLDFGNKSFLQLYALAGIGATTLGSGDDLGTVTNAETAFTALHPVPAGTTISVGDAIQKQRIYRIGGQFIWNVDPRFSVGLWAFYEGNNQGFASVGTNGIDTPLREVSGTRNLYNIGIRPIFWISDNIAIQGQAWGSYQDNNRGYAGDSSFGRSGSMGVFTIAPTIKPKGGYFTRPEIRVFATWAIWSDSLKGATTPIQEGGNFGPSIAPYNGNTNQGWLFGTQLEWFF